MTINMSAQPDGPPTVSFTDSPAQTKRVAEGAFIVISDDNLTTGFWKAYAGMFNGRVFRVGNFRQDLSTQSPTYELAPGYDAYPGPGAPIDPVSKLPVSLTGAVAYVVGRTY